MDNEKRGEDRSTYSGRFGDSAGARQRPTGSFRTQPAGSYRSRSGYQDARAARRPSGFATIDREKAAPQAENAQRASNVEAPKSAVRPEKKKKAAPKERPPREKRPRRGLKALAFVALGAVVLLLLVALLFGGDPKTYHQLPTVERESAAFTPDKTSAPGGAET